MWFVMSLIFIGAVSGSGSGVTWFPVVGWVAWAGVVVRVMVVVLILLGGSLATVSVVLYACVSWVARYIVLFSVAMLNTYPGSWGAALMMLPLLFRVSR